MDKLHAIELDVWVLHQGNLLGAGSHHICWLLLLFCPCWSIETGRATGSHLLAESFQDSCLVFKLDTLPGMLLLVEQKQNGSDHQLAHGFCGLLLVSMDGGNLPAGLQLGFQFFNLGSVAVAPELFNVCFGDKLLDVVLMFVGAQHCGPEGNAQQWEELATDSEVGVANAFQQVHANQQLDVEESALSSAAPMILRCVAMYRPRGMATSCMPGFMYMHNL